MNDVTDRIGVVKVKGNENNVGYYSIILIKIYYTKFIFWKNLQICGIKT